MKLTGTEARAKHYTPVKGVEFASQIYLTREI